MTSNYTDFLIEAAVISDVTEFIRMSILFVVFSKLTEVQFACCPDWLSRLIMNEL